MHKVRRKRFLQKLKKRRKEKERREAQENANLESDISTIHLFKRYDKFVGCNEALDKLFVPAAGDYYRIVHNPPQLNDQLVQSEQQYEGLAPSMPNLPDTIEPGSSVEDQFEHIADWSLSFNVDDKLLANGYWAGYDKRKNEIKKKDYVTRKGDAMALYHFTPAAGVIQREPDEDGHVVLVEYDNFVLENYRVVDFGLKPLTDYRDEKK